MDRIIKFADYKIFENEEQIFIYCVADNKIFEIDDRLLALLKEDGKTYGEIKNNMETLFSDSELDELIESMYELGLIEKESHDVCNHLDEATGDISSITLLVAQDCNLRCSYCYAEEGKYNNCGKMDITTAKKCVDFLIEKSGSNKLGICFFGGEPLLNFELIKEVVEYCHKKEEETGKKFGFSMTSNGTLINDEIEKFILQNRINVQISIDGDKETHDANRYYSGKIGSFDNVLKKTKSLREKGLLDARGTITTKELDLVHTYDFLTSIGFKNIALSPAFNLLLDNEYDKVADAFIKFYRNFEDRIKEKKYEEVRSNRMFMRLISDIHNSKIRKRACGAGNNLYAVGISGDIYPCQRFIDTKEVKLGNVFENDNMQKEFLQNTKIDRFKKCSSCWIRNLCVGGCINDNFAQTKDVCTPYDVQCEYNRKIVTEAIKIYLRLSEEEIDELFEEKNEQIK